MASENIITGIFFIVDIVNSVIALVKGGLGDS
jgi:hypothetical protein